MLKRNLEELSIYKLDEDIETLPLNNLKYLYLERPSEIIYVVRDDRLQGIICMGDVGRYSRNGEVKINKDYTVLTGHNIVKAHQIFQRKKNVHKIPVIGDDGKLLGDYSRWDDSLYINRIEREYFQDDIIKDMLKSYGTIYVMISEGTNLNGFEGLKRYLDYHSVTYTLITIGQVTDKVFDDAVCLFGSEDERRAARCLLDIKIMQQEDAMSHQLRLKLKTFRELLCEIDGIRTQSQNTEAGNKSAYIIHQLMAKGIKCFCLFDEEYPQSEYWADLKAKIADNTKKHPLSLKGPWYAKDKDGELYDIFYGDLSMQQDYMTGKAQEEICRSSNAYEREQNITGKYFNAKNGRRITSFQPNEGIGTIYLFGRCSLVGFWAEDQYTISSYLQKKLLERGYRYRVENFAGMARPDAEIDSKLLEIGKCKETDIMIFFMDRKIECLKGNLLETIFEKNDVLPQYFFNSYSHYNNRVNCYVAEGLLEMIRECLIAGTDEEVQNQKESEIGIQDVIKQYVKQKYFDKYFPGFDKDKYKRVGAAVMQADPFSLQERFSLEWASKKVDLLIVFIIEGANSLFTLEERYEMLYAGTKDMKNVMVVSGGDFIMSKTNYPEYYTQHKSQVIELNAEYDSNFFAEYIAGHLGISDRFIESEPEDEIIKIYNEKMKCILPEKGIRCIEFPETEAAGGKNNISAIQKYLKAEDYEHAFAMLPDITQEYLKGFL